MTLLTSFEFPKSDKSNNFIGFWYQIVDTRGNVIYRNIIRDFGEAEVINEDGSLSIISIKGSTTFEILIPDVIDSEKIQFFARAKSTGEPLKPVMEFMIHEIKSYKDRKGRKYGN